MNKIILSQLYVLLSILVIQATDLYVRENGLNGAYATITDAVLAAASGDRIVIKPKSGNAPYVENITIDKNLQFLSEDEGQMFTVQGNYEIDATNVTEVTIISMKNTSGYVKATQYNASDRCHIKILNSYINGEVSAGHSDGGLNLNFTLTLAHSEVYGRVTFSHGKLMGNVINVSENSSNYVTAVNLDLEEDYAIDPGQDTVFIIGNKITATNTKSSTSYAYGVFENSYSSNTKSYYVYAANNLVTSQYYGMWFFSFKKDLAGANIFVNNTFVMNSPGTKYGLYFYTYNSMDANNIVNVYNNLFYSSDKTNTTQGLVLGSGALFNVSYNHFNDNVYTAIKNGTNDGTNVTNSNFSLNTTSGVVSGDPIDAGNPDSVHYDIDLTPNDVGVYGGSFTLDNFHSSNTSYARIYFLDVPRRVSIGENMKVYGEAYDK